MVNGNIDVLQGKRGWTVTGYAPIHPRPFTHLTRDEMWVGIEHGSCKERVHLTPGSFVHPPRSWRVEGDHPGSPPSDAEYSLPSFQDFPILFVLQAKSRTVICETGVFVAGPSRRVSRPLRASWHLSLVCLGSCSHLCDGQCFPQARERHPMGSASGQWAPAALHCMRR